ncbi:MAG: electron transfer flavoprotein-ubiquinone oxidoreductase [Saezia sp.]
MTNEYELLQKYGPRESMEYDVVIVGAGPAGLAAAIHLKTLEPKISVCVLEKGSEPGAHILAGTLFDPDVLSDLIPDWESKEAPIGQPILHEEVLMLSENKLFELPHFLTPYNFRSDGCYILGLGSMVRWLAKQAEELGVEVFPGFAATQVLYNEKNKVIGVITGNMGLDKQGKPTANFQLGIELRASYTIFAEGSRGNMGLELIEKFKLDSHADPQSYSLGIKELWEVPPAQHRLGTAIHTAGWPLDTNTYGGGFIYHMEGNKVALGLVIGLDYSNPWLDPFEEMQRWKTHPAIKATLKGGKRIGYGARTITAGGIFSLPKLSFPGGVLVGCDAGFLNASRIKGVHTAMKSGMLASEAIISALRKGAKHADLTNFQKKFEHSSIYTELQQSKNFKQWFKKGLYIGSLMTGIENLVLPWIGVRNPLWSQHAKKEDYATLRLAQQAPKINYPKPDGKITFDKMSSLYLSNTHHEENQPIHLALKDNDIPVKINLKQYGGVEERYCPAGVYEFVQDDQGSPRLQINASNCLHCKTCDIKDPHQNIVWTPPEGGGGPNYTDM